MRAARRSIRRPQSAARAVPLEPASLQPVQPVDAAFSERALHLAAADPRVPRNAPQRGTGSDGPEFVAELQRLRATEAVDYPGVAQAKLPLLRVVYDHFVREHLARGTPRARAFLAFQEERGESLRLHALHDAIDEHLRAQNADTYWGWPVWPDELRHPARAGVQVFAAAHAESVDSTPGCNGWPTSNSPRCSASRRELGMPIGLYGDYAVGVNPSGSETWSDQSVYRMGAGVGAPPDALALKGQDWGIPPQDPYVLIAEHYRPFRNLIAANMRHFGALRLDHVMALFRQWWVPVGLGSTDGGYVHYPLDDLMSVLALESERARCLVVGEDLGTVPPRCATRWTSAPSTRYQVLLFEKHADGSFRRPGAVSAPRDRHGHDARPADAARLLVGQRPRAAPPPALLSRARTIRRQVFDDRVRDRAQLLAALEERRAAAAGRRTASSARSANLPARSSCTWRAARRRSSCCRSRT